MVYFHDRVVFITNDATFFQRYNAISNSGALIKKKRERERKTHLKGDIETNLKEKMEINLCEIKRFKFVTDTDICISIEIQGRRTPIQHICPKYHL